MNKKILIICESNLSKSPRVRKQIDALKLDYQIILAGDEWNREEKNITFIKIKKAFSHYTFHHQYPWLLKKTISLIFKFFSWVRGGFHFGSFERKYWDSPLRRWQYKILLKLNFDLIICHHLELLPLANRLSKNKNCEVISNLHEYYPLEFENDVNWLKNNFEFKNFVCRNYLRNSKSNFVVGKFIGEKYNENYGIKYEVIPNDKPFHDIFPKKTESDIKIIHHGAAIRHRNLEEMVEVINFLPENYLLYFMLTANDAKYLEQLKNQFKNHPRVNFLEPVPPEKIIETISKFDLGLYILEPNGFNNEFALPNKFFEFIQARLCIVIAPSPEMALYVKKYNLGVVSRDFNPESMAMELKKLSPEDIDSYKENVHRAAFELGSVNTEKLIKKRVDQICDFLCVE